MTLPTPERVRELLAMFSAKNPFLTSTVQTPFCRDTATILADWLQMHETEDEPDLPSPTPSAQAKCEQRTLTGDERDAIRRAYWKSVTPVALAQAREALEAGAKLLEMAAHSANVQYGSDAERCALEQAAILRSLSANVGGGAVASQWRDIATAPKGRKLIVGYRNETGMWRAVMATYYRPGTLEAPDDYESESEFAPEGWYEEVENSEECLRPTRLPPTHWMPLFAAPVSA